MIRKLAPLAVVGFVAACGGNPLNFGGNPPPVEPPAEAPEPGEAIAITGIEVPAAIAHNLRSASFTPGAPEITIDLVALDGTPRNAVYTREASLDIGDFDAYVIQESPAHRKFIALFRRSGAVDGGVVGDGGQFGSYLAGANYSRLQPFTLPTPADIGRNSLLATYTGGYVGVLNGGMAVPYPGAPFDPSQPFRVSGDVMLNADFNENNMEVEGGIRNRRIVDTGTALGSVYLKITQITPEGAFSGVISYAEAGQDYNADLGHYSGIFGGTAASDVAGGTLLTPVPGNDEIVEHGAFVGARCPAGGGAPPCP